MKQYKKFKYKMEILLVTCLFTIIPVIVNTNSISINTIININY